VIDMAGIRGVGQLVDDNGKGTLAYSPLSGQRLTGVETTTQVAATTASSLLRIVGTAAINYNISTSTTDAVTTSMAYLPANTIEYVKVVKGIERFAFLGSSVVYITALR
jgi:hypothetical protein